MLWGCVILLVLIVQKLTKSYNYEMQSLKYDSQNDHTSQNYEINVRDKNSNYGCYNYESQNYDKRSNYETKS